METEVSMKKVASIVLSVVLGLVLLFGSANLFETVDSGEHVVIQSINGNLAWYHDAGIKWQGWGKVTRYKKSFQDEFESSESLNVMFNDGGSGMISGSVRIDLPSDEKSLTELHIRYGSQEAIETQLVRKVIEKSVYMSGPMMSSKESYAERKNELISLIEDQASRGVYSTESVSTEAIDPLTGQKRKAILVQAAKKDGIIVRVEESPLNMFNVKLFNFSINGIKYNEVVESQIVAQQKAVMDVQTAISQARKAEQDKLTTEAQGAATAAKAKWDQETENAKIVAAAEGRAKAAKADKEAAEYTKAKDILLGEGEAARKRLVMDANGALDAKLEAWVKAQEVWADSYSKSVQPHVPQIIMGGSDKQGSSAQDFMDMIKVKTAKELAVDFDVRKK